MSFSEWWNDDRDPMVAGTVQVGGGHMVCHNRFLVVARLAFILIGLPVLWWFAVPYVDLPTWQAWMLVVGVTFIYVALSYLLNPQPDERGLIIEERAQYPSPGSDIWNRFLIFLALFLGPGRFIAESGLDALIVLQSGREDRDPADSESNVH